MTSKAKREKELRDLQDEQHFHEREWATQRVGWGLLAILLLFGFAGAFGDGPLADKTIETPEGRIEFERFVRRNATTEWKITPQLGNTPQTVRVAIDSAFIDKFQIREITPKPTRELVAAGAVTFEFDAPTSSGRIVFHVEAQHIGRPIGTFRIGGASAVVSQLIYP
jgi:hypothetical protein